MAGQDYRKLIPPGATLSMSGVGGDYIYLKFADRPIDVIVQGGRSGQSRVTMEAGDKYRPGEFQGLELENSDKNNPAQVIFTIGEGDYNRQIVQGEITVATGVRKADGRLVDDKRVTLSGQISPVYGFAGQSFAVGDTLETLPIVGVSGDRFEFSTMHSLQQVGNKLLVFVRAGSFTAERTALLEINTALQSYTEVSPSWLDNSVNAILQASNVIGGYIFLRDPSTQDHEVRYYDPASSSQKILCEVSNQDFIRSIAVRGKYLYLIVDSEINKVQQWEIAESGASAFYVKTFDVSGAGAGQELQHIDYCQITDTFTLSGSNSDDAGAPVPVEVTPNFEPIRALDFTVAPGQSSEKNMQWVIVGGAAYGWRRADENLLKLATEATEIKLKGFASPVACDITNINPDYDAAQTTANITTEKQNGQLQVTGEIIRAFLELYYRTKIPNGYLDHVYSITIYNTLTGAVTQSEGGNGATFDFLNLEDNFQTYLPARIDVTIDSELPTLNPLEF